VKCPYYSAVKKWCHYLKGRVECAGELVRSEPLEYADLPNQAAPHYTYACPIIGEIIGSKEEIEMLFKIHARLGLEDLIADG